VAKNFKDLSEQEIVALAISSEETDARIYADLAAGFPVLEDRHLFHRTLRRNRSSQRDDSDSV
jgi:hypothetical protein